MKMFCQEATENMYYKDDIGVNMSFISSLAKGTLILTSASFISKLLGFFHRIFLSQIFSAEEIGIYQLIIPVFTLCYSITTAGFQTALSKLTASHIAFSRKDNAISSLKTALFYCISLSIIFLLILQSNADYIALNFLNDPRCSTLIIALSYVLPFSSIHSCITGYYLGLQNTFPIANSQLIEQIVRVLSIFLLYKIGLHNSFDEPICIAILGLILGEIFSSLYCIHTLKGKHFLIKKPLHHYIHDSKSLFLLSLPLTINRLLLNTFQSYEAISIPKMLCYSGLARNESLALYGVLTGMAFPCIFFPSALTNSLSALSLTTVASLSASKNVSNLHRFCKKIIYICFFVGITCMLFFFFFGNILGNILFNNHVAGNFLQTLSFICPFIYLNSALLNIINGFGKTHYVLFINIIGLLIRIAAVFLLIPPFQMKGYLWGLLISQIIITCLSYSTYRFLITASS